MEPVSPTNPSWAGYVEVILLLILAVVIDSSTIFEVPTEV